MEEFAKFMNKRTPRLLEEFARSRLRQPKNVELNEVKHVIDQVENLEHLWPLDETKSREESNTIKTSPVRKFLATMSARIFDPFPGEHV